MRTPSTTASDFDSCSGATAPLPPPPPPPGLGRPRHECQITGKSTPSASECNGTGNTLPGGAFETLRGLAVDSSDNLWITDSHATGPHVGSLVDKFDSASNFILQGDGEPTLITEGSHSATPRPRSTLPTLGEATSSAPIQTPASA